VTAEGPEDASEGAPDKGKIGSLAGLPGLSLDALTSVAYGPEAIVVVLATAGAGAVGDVRPITVAIVVLLAILVFSYRQVIAAYPDGGGAYAVSKENLGTVPSLLAGASLIVDYILTVAVSVTAGVAALTSAFPGLNTADVPIGLALLVVLTVLNLFGLSESARAFFIPTLIFIGGLYVVVFAGLIHPFGQITNGPHGLSTTTSTVGVLLILKAFASGCSALTGVEAIANGTPVLQGTTDQASSAHRAATRDHPRHTALGSLAAGGEVPPPTPGPRHVAQPDHRTGRWTRRALLRRRAQHHLGPGAGREHQLRGSSDPVEPAGPG
jgi:amino acid transporter